MNINTYMRTGSLYMQQPVCTSLTTYACVYPRKYIVKNVAFCIFLWLRSKLLIRYGNYIDTLGVNIKFNLYNNE